MTHHGRRIRVSLCSVVTAGLGVTAGPAWADEQLPALPNTAAIVASAAPSAPTQPDPAGAVPQTPVIPPVEPVIPGPVPPESVALPVTQPAAAAVPPTTPPSAPPEVSPSPSTPPPPETDDGDTANSAPNNTNGITGAIPKTPVQMPSETVVWNGAWNIIAVCGSCNIAVSVRVASPGDSGQLVQQLVVQSQLVQPEISPPAVAASALAAALAPPVQPPEPVVPNPAPAPASAALAASSALNVEEESPRRGIPPHEGASASRGLLVRPLPSEVRLPITRGALQFRAVERGSPSTAGSSAGAVPLRSVPSRPPPSKPLPSRPLPPAPVPALLSAGSLGEHGGGSNANAALTTMALAGLVLVFLSRVRSIARSIRREDAFTQPDPPG